MRSVVCLMCCLTRNLGCVRRKFLGCAAAVMGVLSCVACWPRNAGAVEPEWIMYQDPQLQKPAFEQRFEPGLAQLWLQALTRPERDLKRRAAAAITLAQQKGLAGLEVTIEPLMREFQQRGRISWREVGALVIYEPSRKGMEVLLDSLRFVETEKK